MSTDGYADCGTVAIRRHGAAQTSTLLNAAAEVWADARRELAAPEAAGDRPCVEQFKRQVADHLTYNGFTLAAAYGDGAMVGFGYAFPCTPEHWFGAALLPSIPERARSGTRLMGLCDVAVRPAWQSRGIGSRLHAELVKAIAPEWSSVLALPSNARGRSLYERLGYRYAGPYRGTPDRPTLDLLLLHLGAENDGGSLHRRAR